MATPYLGLNLLPTNSPDYEGGLSPVALASANFSILDRITAIEVEAASGAIGITQGTAIITKSSAAAVMTLASPAAGLPAAAGNDGQVLQIFCTTAQAHTVTTASNKINGNKHILTFAAVGDSAVLIAYNTVWYLVAATAVLS